MEGFQEARKSHEQEVASVEAKMFDESPMRRSPLLESGMLKNDFGDMCGRYYGFQTKARKSADPRTLRLLEFFRHLYYRRRETFKKMVPSGLQEEFEELFNKIGSLLTLAKSKHEVRPMQRSFSAGSRQQQSSGGGSDLRLDRFKVRIVQVDSGGSSK